MRQFIILIKSKYNSYTKEIAGSLNILANFLTDDVGKGRAGCYIIEDLKDPGFDGMAFNLCEIDKIGEKLHINYELVPLENPFVISQNELIEIIKKWCELTEAGVEKIILTEENDGSFTVKEG